MLQCGMAVELQVLIEVKPPGSPCVPAHTGLVIALRKIAPDLVEFGVLRERAIGHWDWNGSPLLLALGCRRIARLRTTLAPGWSVVGSRG